MGNRRLDMHRLQEVIRLHRLGESGRSIAKPLKIGRNTNSAYVEAISKAGLLEGPANLVPLWTI
jgi:transposase